MTYRLFLDDERFPPNDGTDWVICRTKDEVMTRVAEFGFPSFVSFDHDLGDGIPTGMDVAIWLVDCDLDDNCIPIDFAFYVHSQNPVGKANI